MRLMNQYSRREIRPHLLLRLSNVCLPLEKEVLLYRNIHLTFRNIKCHRGETLNKSTMSRKSNSSLIKMVRSSYLCFTYIVFVFMRQIVLDTDMN